MGQHWAVFMCSQDLQHFFLQPIIDRRDNLNPTADEEDGDEAPEGGAAAADP